MGTFRVLCVCLAVSCASGSLLGGLLSGVHDQVHTVANTVKNVVHGGASNRLHVAHGGHQHYPMNQGGQAPDVVNVVVVVQDERNNPGYGPYNHRPHHHHERPPYHGGHQGYGQCGQCNQNQEGGNGNYHHGYAHGVYGGQQDFANQNQPGYGGQYGNGNNQGYGQQGGHGYNNNHNQGQNPTNFGQANPKPEGNFNQNNQNNEQKIPTHFDQTTTLKPSGYSEQSKPGFGQPTMLQPLKPINVQKEPTQKPDSENDDPLHVALNNPNEYNYGDKDTKEPKRETQADDEDAIDVRFGN